MRKLLLACVFLGLSLGTVKAEDPVLFLRRSMQYEMWLLQRDYYRSLGGPTASPYSYEYERMLLETPTVWGDATANDTQEMTINDVTVVANQGLTLTEFFLIEDFPEFYIDMEEIDNDPFSDPAMIHLWYDTLYPLGD